MVNKLPVIQRQRGVCCDIEVAMDPTHAREAADLLKLLADPTRLSILATLRQARQPVCICDFTAAYGLSQPTISHHMGKLRGAGLVEANKIGVWVHYRLADRPSLAVTRLLDALLTRP